MLQFGLEPAGGSSHRVIAVLTGGVLGRQSDFRSGGGGINVAFRTAANTAVNWDNNAGQRNGSANFANVIRSVSSYQGGPGGYWTPTSGGGSTYVGGGGGTWTASISGPGAFSDRFLLFAFQDSGAIRYGWVEVTSATVNAGTYQDMSVTLGRVVYDNSGALVGAGQAPIPEPASAAAAMGGAVVLGAVGLRRWRRERGS